MDNFALETEKFEDELKKLDQEEQYYKECIIKNFLPVESFWVYRDTLNLISKKEIKSELIKKFLLTSREVFDKNLKLVESFKKNLMPMKSKENNHFKEELSKESQIVQKLVRNLNNVFTIQYENYSWDTFNGIYGVEELLNKINLNRINRKLHKLSKKLNEKSIKDIKLKEVIKTSLFSERNELNIGILLRTNKASLNYALK